MATGGGNCCPQKWEALEGEIWGKCDATGGVGEETGGKRATILGQKRPRHYQSLLPFHLFVARFVEHTTNPPENVPPYVPNSSKYSLQFYSSIFAIYSLLKLNMGREGGGGGKWPIISGQNDPATIKVFFLFLHLFVEPFVEHTTNPSKMDPPSSLYYIFPTVQNIHSAIIRQFLPFSPFVFCRHLHTFP
jgi:hypothetical protein